MLTVVGTTVDTTVVSMTERVPGAVMVIAKTPEAGRVKTRLTPPLSATQACEVAWACLADTLDAASAVAAQRHVLVLDGAPGLWVPDGFEVIAQRGVGLGDRLTAAFCDVDDTAIVIAMDTPQVDARVLTAALAALGGSTDSVMGPAIDGGYWLIGLRRGVDAAAVFAGVPMSTPGTGRAQTARLQTLGLTTEILGELRDIDTIDDLWAVGAEYPDTRLGRLAGALRDHSGVGPR
jgi:uncharacterized protein